MTLFSKIRQSLPGTGPEPTDRRGRMLVMLSNFVLHVHPTTIKRHALRFHYTWYMGLIAFFLFMVEVITGVLLMFYYRPTAQWAYHDMLALRDTARKCSDRLAKFLAKVIGQLP